MSTPVLKRHLTSFRQIWKGGFYAGDPLDRMGSAASWGLFGYVGVPYAIVLRCIRPYIDERTVALEIGPGRGAYTRALLGAASVWCLDALSAEYNRFWEYVGEQPHVRYVEVDDFDCAMLPDDGIDYMFSYGTLCHVPFEGIAAYAAALWPKLRPGANCFWMVADYEKYRGFIEEPPSVAPALVSQIGRPWLRRLISRVASQVEERQLEKYRAHIAAPEGPDGSWWYDAGTSRTVAMLENVGYRVVEPDVGVDPRSAVVHFVRP